MANALITLLDLTKRTGSDQAVGLLEETVTYAPELDKLAGRAISGTTYKTTSRTLPTVAFRKANDGSDTIKSAYKQKLGECFIIDAQVQMDKAVADAEAASNAPAGQNWSVGSILMDEASGVLMGTYLTVGTQFYYGLNADPNGFSGIQALTAALNTTAGSPVVISATGSSANVQTSAYLVWESVKGVHWVFGNNQGITMLPDWRIQQVSGANSKPLTAYVNNLQGWIGLAINHPLSVARIANIDATHPLTDKLAAQLLSYIPLQMRGSQVAGNSAPNWGGSLKWFMNPQAAYTLQSSRSAATLNASEPLRFAEMPTQLGGLPIVLTNSIVNTEAVVA